jgi:hypothetical protein
MKRIYYLILTITALSLVSQSKVSAQIDKIGSFMSTGTQDAEKLLNAYVSPWINGFGASLSGGWYNTAKTHKPGGFDITFTTNCAFIPEKYKVFNVDELGLGSLERAPGTSTTSPTIAGKNESGPQLNYDTLNLRAFDLPKGTMLSFAPSPMLQLSIGLFKDTEITGRWLPKFKIHGTNDVGFWGVGLKHGLKQWIPGIKKLPWFHLTLQGGYTRLTANAGLEVTPENIGLSGYNTDNIPVKTWNDQNMMVQINSLTGNLLISADIPFVSFYAGVGFVKTKAILKLEGYYPLLGVNENGLAVQSSEKDPVDFQIKNQDGGMTKPRLNAGIRFKFGLFTIHFDYTKANYNVATAGLGICFR